MSISLAKVKERIDASNKAAVNNRSQYPVQEQVTLLELWERTDCKCAPECFCRKHGCTFHWRIRPGLSTDEVIKGLVRSFIDVKQHDTFFRCLNNNLTPPTRIKEAVPIVEDLIKNWNEYYFNALNNEGCILCDNNISNYWLYRFRNLSIDKSIYNFKMLSILLPDSAVPFDVKSRELIIKELGLQRKTPYLSFILKLQSLFQEVLDRSNSKLDDLRRLDQPGIFFDFARQNIRLGKPGHVYEKGFLPLERPLSRVLDKVYYSPGGKSNEATLTRQKCYDKKDKNTEKTISVEQIRSNESRLFDYDLIKCKANADKLFRLLLSKIEVEFGNNMPSSFTIGDIVKLIPKVDTGISSSASYNYAILSLFGSQKERNYFLFENINIQDIFTKEANNPLRNNYLWKNYSKCRVIINPVYIKEKVQES